MRARPGRRLACPTLVLWSTNDDMFELYGDPLDVWQRWAVDVRTGSIGSGHHMAEKAPAELAAAVRDFLQDHRV
jgi:haloacetate dehalogenase